jgi:hypothetical protein
LSDVIRLLNLLLGASDINISNPPADY